MDLQGYKIKNTTICDCGHEFTIYDMKKLQRITDSKFYGGAVRHVDEIKCPECQKETLLLIKQQGQTYIVKDIAQKDNNLGINNETVKDQKKEIITEATTIDNKGKDNLSDKLICPECKRSFKNKSGLTNHMKVHKK